MSAESTATTVDEKVTEYITHHVTDGQTWTLGGYHLEFANMNLPTWFKLSGLMGLIGATILCLLFCKVYNQRSRVPRGWTNALESLVVFVRDEISVAYLGREDGRRLAWLFITQFSLILTLNLMGLIPIFATATGNLSITSALAFTTFLAMVGGGIYKNGLLGFFQAFIPHGVPLPVLFLLVPIEIAGVFIKTIVLAIRLFANMLAGHIVLFAMLGMVVVYGLPAAPAFLLALFVFFLEILVAFLQAYIFTMLSAIFIGQIYHPDH